MNRTIQDLTEQEIQKINDLLKGEYYYQTIHPLKTWGNVDYQLFDKSHACYSGKAVVTVYLYLLSIGIDVMK